MRSRLVGASALLIALGSSVLSAGARAQGMSGESPVPAVALEDFRLSGPPALALLGSSASSVTRPNTPRDLIASLVSGAGSNGIVPDGFAMETAPYWLSRHRTLGLRDYYNASLADRLKYFTAVSVATSRKRSRTDSAADDAHVSLALRTLLFNGRPSRALLAVGDSMRGQQLVYLQRYGWWEGFRSRSLSLASLKLRLGRQEELLSSLETKVLVGQQAALRDSAMRTLARRDSLRALVAAASAATDSAAATADDLDRIEARLATLAKRFAGHEAEPDGFMLEMAGGIRSEFENGQWGRQRTDGFAAWVTPMYRIGEYGFELIGVARYMSNVRDYDGQNLLDIGARAGVDIGKGTLGAEHVWRSVHNSSQLGLNTSAAVNRRHTTRWAVLFDYPLGGKLWAVASFGSDYRLPDGDRPVIATIGINLGFGAIEILPSAR